MQGGIETQMLIIDLWTQCRKETVDERVALTYTHYHV